MLTSFVLGDRAAIIGFHSGQIDFTFSLVICFWEPTLGRGFS